MSLLFILKNVFQTNIILYWRESYVIDRYSSKEIAGLFLKYVEYNVKPIS